MKKYLQALILVIFYTAFFYIFSTSKVLAQSNLNQAYQNPSTWNEALKNKKGHLKIYYTDSEGFISRKEDGLMGIEYEMMLAFFAFIEKEYKTTISYEFEEIKEFSELYEKSKTGKPGEFFMASFSITPARQKEVKFSPAYMPDIEIMICSENLPVIYDTATFVKEFAQVKGLAVKNSTYEANLMQIKKKYLPNLEIEYVKYYDEIRDRIANEDNLFSYTQLAGYLLLKLKGHSFKRQNIFKVQKAGQGIIYSKQSDWEEPINAFFKSEEFKPLINQLVRKYLGDDIKDLVWDLEEANRSGSQGEIMLLTKEKEMQLSDIQEKELEIIRKNNLIIYFIVGLVLILMLVFFLINRYQLKQKSNRILQLKNTQIEEQKSELVSQTEELMMQKEHIQEQNDLISKNHNQLEETNKKVFDSINAAKTIQFTLLPFESRMQKSLGEHFVIYQPKDIVSGDFYWLNEVGDKTLVALVDCTGHGIPGAFMTLIAYAFLNEIILEKNITDPAQILERLDQQLIYAFQYEVESGSRLGMDISICSIQKGTPGHPVNIIFSGAKQSVYIYRQEEKKLEKFKGIRRSLTCRQKSEHLDHFINEEFTASKGDILYLFTDGLLDIPNAKRRNFGPQRFQEMLLKHAHLPITEQKEAYLAQIKDFQQEEEQRDDIAFMAVQIGDSFIG